MRTAVISLPYWPNSGPDMFRLCDKVLTCNSFMLTTCSYVADLSRTSSLALVLVGAGSSATYATQANLGQPCIKRRLIMPAMSLRHQMGEQH